MPAAAEDAAAFLQDCMGSAAMARLSCFSLIICDTCTGTETPRFGNFLRASRHLTLPAAAEDAAAFLRGCMGSAAMARLPRFNFICDDCSGEELDAWREQPEVGVLRRYGTQSGFEPRTTDKLVVDPERVHGFRCVLCMNHEQATRTSRLSCVKHCI